MSIGFLGISETYVDFFSNVVHYGAIMDSDLAKFALWLYKSIEHTIFHDIKSIIDTT